MWRDRDDSDRGGLGRERRMKVCEACRKIILLREDLAQRRGEDGKPHTWCSRCAPGGEDDAGEG